MTAPSYDRRPRSSEDDLLTATEAASLLGVQPSTFRAYVTRRQAPQPDPLHTVGTMRRWRRSVLQEWHANRPGPVKFIPGHRGPPPPD